jgi:twitching motility protein PilT
MSVVPSLLHAIVRLDGEALVLHVGEKPYVVAPSGQVDLASRGLTLDAVTGIVAQLLPLESQRALDEFGAAQYELPHMPEFAGEHFTIVAARGGDDVWAEIRRRRVPDDDRVPLEMFDPPAPTGAASAPAPVEPPPAAPLDTPVVTLGAREHWSAIKDQPAIAEVPVPEELHPPAGTVTKLEPEPEPETTPSAPPFVPSPPITPPVAVRPPLAGAHASRTVAAPTAGAGELRSVPARPQALTPPVALPDEIEPAPAEAPAAVEEPSPPAVVLPLARNPIRPDSPPPLVEQASSGLDRMLRLAAARGASTLYLSSSARPSVRVDGDVQTLDGAPILSPNDVESLLLTLMPERSAEALRTGVASEWIADVSDVGRVRCMSFRDHRGPGGVFRLMSGRGVTADQLGLSRIIQTLAVEPEGLVLVAGPRSSGKRTVIAGMVDLINRSRRDHIITIENEINVVHEPVGCFISQREVRGSSEDTLAVANAALREDPDVLVIGELRTAGLVNVALEAASRGQLVIGGFPAHTASRAIDRIIDLYPPEHRQQVQLSLAQNLRGIVAQVLLRKRGGGRVAAREVLLNTPAVASVLAEGTTSQLPMAIEGGRKHGMVPLNDALVGFVQGGAVDAREAYRLAPDRPGFLALLKRQGVDTSFAERLA